jgi:cell division transport system ATP-binding protein
MILFADEPTGNLDPEIGEEMMLLFKEINKSGTAILMATHNHTFLDKFPARVLKVDEEAILDSEKDAFSFRHR